MSPHGLVFLTSIMLGAAGKALFPRFTLRVIAASAVALPLCVSIYFGETPSLLGIALVAPITLAGAVIGVAGGGYMNRLRRPG